MKKSLVVCWIKHIDYPLFRLFLKRHQNFFDEIIIYWSQHHREYNFDKFIVDSFVKDGIKATFLDPIEYEYGKEDWRNVATNHMLKYATGDWICSVEQDFFSSDWPLLFCMTEDAMKEADLVGWMNKTNAPYIHPSYFFCKRELIEAAGRDFTPHPEVNGGDHFAAITWKAKEMGRKIAELNVGQVVPTSLGFHLGGVNQNYLDGIKNGIFHRGEIFRVYNYWSKRAMVEQSPEFNTLIDKAEEVLQVKYPNIHPESDEWSMFFK